MDAEQQPRIARKNLSGQLEQDMLLTAYLALKQAVSAIDHTTNVGSHQKGHKHNQTTSSCQHRHPPVPTGCCQHLCQSVPLDDGPSQSVFLKAKSETAGL
jgi:hypothetical protein